MLRSAVWFGAFALVLAGCGGADDRPEAVSGHVLYRGKPLAGGTIVFEPDPERGGDGPVAGGEIGPDGRYALRPEDGSGVSPGWHRVTFAAASGTTLPLRYSDPARCGQSCEVKAGRANEINFDLQ
jgi:hypothetical protein